MANKEVRGWAAPDHRPTRERQRRGRRYLPTGERPGRG